MNLGALLGVVFAAKKKGPSLKGLALLDDWWSWRDLNPRPQAFSEQFYMCSRLIGVSPLVLRSGTPHKRPAPLNLTRHQGARRHASQYEIPRSQDSFSTTLAQPIGQLLRGSPD